MARQFPVAAAAAAFLSICALEGCTKPQHSAHQETARGASDAREAIILSRAERDLLLAEMRLMLESTEGVVAGLAA